MGHISVLFFPSQVSPKFSRVINSIRISHTGHTQDNQSFFQNTSDKKKVEAFFQGGKFLFDSPETGKGTGLFID